MTALEELFNKGRVLHSQSLEQLVRELQREINRLRELLKEADREVYAGEDCGSDHVS